MEYHIDFEAEEHPELVAAVADGYAVELAASTVSYMAKSTIEGEKDDDAILGLMPSFPDPTIESEHANLYDSLLGIVSEAYDEPLQTYPMVLERVEEFAGKAHQVHEHAPDDSDERVARWAGFFQLVEEQAKDSATTVATYLDGTPYEHWKSTMWDIAADEDREEDDFTTRLEKAHGIGAATPADNRQQLGMSFESFEEKYDVA